MDHLLAAWTVLVKEAQRWHCGWQVWQKIVVRVKGPGRAEALLAVPKKPCLSGRSGSDWKLGRCCNGCCSVLAEADSDRLSVLRRGTCRRC